ncbi:protein FAR1-RELATED SEQUENCE 5-like [Nicotiana sylvestris]|uniref:Protein FAR1-RELATED SEQUENCE n=1 Tax=Nicotiana sylvestris TaxID=4096 RepID=A0A1U7W7D0_NICSY|nr:PREDICTED: protein FAR1-RELATED SEQUENCE 5-like [Nicotiana sylvestris]
MSGKTPKTIFTNQDAAMSKAISFVMPEVHHRLCVWHMEQNAVKHLNQVYKRYASFRGDFRKCIYEYEDEGEFINAWTSMLDEYNLHENECFFKHYDRAIEDKRYNELQDTCDALRLPILKAKVPILFHAREVYTPNSFSKFQDEYMKSLIIKVNGCEENNFPIMYKVSKYGHTREQIVKVTEADHISCTCMKFESMGILCCHTIRILDVIRGVDKIPDEYILKRWTKTTKVVNIKEIDGQDIEIKDSKLIVVNRYRILCPIFVRMAAKASETDEGYKLAAICANELSTRLKQIMEVTAPSLHTTGSTRDLPEENNDRDLLSRANNFKNKDNTKRLKKRIKTSLEANSKSKKAR